MKLNNFEVFISVFKFMIGIGILNQPAQFKNSGVIGGSLVLLIATIINTESNRNFLRCIPKVMANPRQKLTYGQVVNYVLDERRDIVVSSI